jgi:ABC-type phosphate/phosphonate transport system ATPase subunit
VEGCAEDAAALTLTPEAYVFQVHAQVTKFLGEGTLFDRAAVMGHLRSSLTPGSFVLLLGGKNVGKTQVMKALKVELSQDYGAWFLSFCCISTR